MRVELALAFPTGKPILNPYQYEFFILIPKLQIVFQVIIFGRNRNSYCLHAISGHIRVSIERAPKWLQCLPGVKKQFASKYVYIRIFCPKIQTLKQKHISFPTSIFHPNFSTARGCKLHSHNFHELVCILVRKLESSTYNQKLHANDIGNFKQKIFIDFLSTIILLFMKTKYFFDILTFSSIL